VIRENPLDLVPFLASLDHAEELGTDVRRLDFGRSQYAIHQITGGYDPLTLSLAPEQLSRIEANQSRIGALRKLAQENWIPAFPGVRGYYFRRGLVDGVRLSGAVNAGLTRSLSTFSGLTHIGIAGHLSRPLAYIFPVDFSPIRSLSIDAQYTTLEEIVAFLRVTPSLTNLVSLDLRGVRFGRATMRAFLESPALTHLTELHLRESDIDASLLRRLVNSPRARSLITLSLTSSPFVTEPESRVVHLAPSRFDRENARDIANILAGATELSNLTRLDLSYTGVDNARIARILEPGVLPSLRYLRNYTWVGQPPHGRPRRVPHRPEKRIFSQIGGVLVETSE